MKICPYCKITVGGDTEECPLCQNELEGNLNERHWPVIRRLKRTPKIYNLVLFLVLSAAFLSVVWDLLLDGIPGFQFAHVVVIWLLAGLFVFSKSVKSIHNLSGIVTRAVLWSAVILLITSIWYPVFFPVIPILLTGILVFNFIITMLDRRGVSMVYFLGSVLIGIISFILVLVVRRETALPWLICFITAIISFIGIAVFKGRMIFVEVRKRFFL